TVGVMGDFRTYAHVIALRAVMSQDALTADCARLPYDLLGRISNRLSNEVQGVNQVVFDISSKPPSTIEWESAGSWWSTASSFTSTSTPSTASSTAPRNSRSSFRRRRI